MRIPDQHLSFYSMTIVMKALFLVPYVNKILDILFHLISYSCRVASSSWRVWTAFYITDDQRIKCLLRNSKWNLPLPGPDLSHSLWPMANLGPRNVYIVHINRRVFKWIVTKYLGAENSYLWDWITQMRYYRHCRRRCCWSHGRDCYAYLSALRILWGFKHNLQRDANEDWK